MIARNKPPLRIETGLNPGPISQNRQAEIYARGGVELDRSTLADWVGQLGGGIGASLDARDCAQLTTEMQRSLQMSRDGETTYWTSNNGAYHASIVPTATHYQNRTVTIQRTAGVDTPQNLVVTGRNEYAARRTNILAAPQTGASALSTLDRGDAVRVIGYPHAASNHDLIARNGTAVGYVRSADLSHSQPADAGVSGSPQINVASVTPLRETTDLNAASGGEEVDHVSALA